MGWKVAIGHGRAYSRIQGFQIGNERRQLLLRDHAAIRRHDGLVAFDDLGPRIEDGAFEIGLVGDRGAPVAKLDAPAEQPVQPRRARPVAGVTGRAAELLKYIAPLEVRDVSLWLIDQDA